MSELTDTTAPILGINAYHGDSAACVIVGGEVVAAAEEERFLRIKHWSGFPAEAIRYCLEEAGIAIGDVRHIAVNRDPRRNLPRKIRYSILHRPDPRVVIDRLRNARAWLSIEEEFVQAFPQSSLDAEVHYVEHHLAHLASSFLPSPLEEAALVSVDGFGDFASTAWGLGRGNTVRLDGRVYFPHSLGIFYEALTKFLGFPHYGDEYKLMGLAPYGEPSYADALRRLVRLRSDGTFRLDLAYFRHQRGDASYTWRNAAPSSGAHYSQQLVDLLGPPRRSDEEITQHHQDIARSAQVVFEDAFFHLLNTVHARYKVDAIALSGGCAMNSVANGKIHLRTPFTTVYTPPAAADAGGAIGAAAFVWTKTTGSRPRPMRHAFVGPSFGDRSIEELLFQHRDALESLGVRVEKMAHEVELVRRTADVIADGRVVGWFQGRMEWGPRALGNRSIVCDPRRADMKSILNAKIKRRESFRPFAPSMLRGDVSEWFERDDDVPFMTKVFQIRKEKRDLIPAVTHVDGSGRVQTVEREDNPRYYELISAFKEKTGIPIVLNTSFNENEPVVCKPGEALDCFLRSEMDVVVLGDFFLERQRLNDR